jgi:hypothetical protein
MDVGISPVHERDRAVQCQGFFIIEFSQNLMMCRSRQWNEKDNNS